MTIQTIIVSDGLVKITGTSEPLRATLKDSSDSPLSETDVKFTINGVTYTRTTDSNGVAYQEIGLSPNTYTVTYEYLTPGEYDYCYLVGVCIIRLMVLNIPVLLIVMVLHL